MFKSIGAMIESWIFQLFLAFLPPHARTPLKGSQMPTQPPAIGDDGLIPRRYQEEIFEKAVHGNVIAALDTGSGKTLISTLLIKWVSTQGYAHKKLVVFLVPKVALAQQQGAFIAKHSPLRVKQATGATAPDMSDRIGWQELLSDVDVIVLTGEFLFFSSSSGNQLRVSSTVIPQCHHTFTLDLEQGS